MESKIEPLQEPLIKAPTIHCANQAGSNSRALTKSDGAARKTGFALPSSPLKRQQIDSAGKIAGFAMKFQEKHRMSGDFVRAAAQTGSENERRI
jgi:hypothetical protein